MSEHQSIRDTERDVLLINGHRVLGSAGFPAVVAHIVSTLRHMLPGTGTDATATTEPGAGVGGGAEAGGDSGNRHAVLDLDFEALCGVDNVRLEGFAKAILRAVNRTESGHHSFGLVSNLCRNDQQVVIVPDSHRAGPLTIELCCGPVCEPSDGLYRQHRRVWGWGLCAAVSALTVYNLYDQSMEAVMASVNANYVHRLALPLDLGSSSAMAARGVAWEQVCVVLLSRVKTTHPQY